MIEELKEIGLNVGYRRVSCVRQENDPPDRFQNLSHCVKMEYRWSERANTRRRPLPGRRLQRNLPRGGQQSQVQ